MPHKTPSTSTEPFKPHGSSPRAPMHWTLKWVLWALALAHVWKGIRHAGAGVARQNPVPILFIIGGLALQLALLHVLGFSIASGLLFACTAAAFGKRNFAVSLPAGIAFALVVYGVFDQLLKLNLPAGFLETLIFGG